MIHAMSPPPPTFRPAAPHDLQAVHAIYMHPAVVPYLGVDPMPIEPFATVFDALRATGRFIVAEVDGRVRAFYRTMRHEGRARHVAMIGTFAVAPESHGSGLAARVIDHAIAQLRAEGVTRVELMAEADNPRGLRFYEKLGFVREGVMRAAYHRAGDAQPVDEIILARLLDDGRAPLAGGDAPSKSPTS